MRGFKQTHGYDMSRRNVAIDTERHLIIIYLMSGANIADAVLNKALRPVTPTPI